RSAASSSTTTTSWRYTTCTSGRSPPDRRRCPPTSSSRPRWTATGCGATWRPSCANATTSPTPRCSSTTPSPRCIGSAVPEVATPTAPAHVLVVDDDEGISSALRRALEYEGLRVSLARDGYAALDEIRRHAPDLVVLDLMLPGLDGLEVCQRLRAERS